MSSKYPVLDSRPIDQWKVTELKEELRKRGYPLRGLKEELVRRLDEALRKEAEESKMEEQPAQEEQAEESNGSDPQDNCDKEEVQKPPAEEEQAEESNGSDPLGNCDKEEVQKPPTEDDARVAVEKNLKIDDGVTTIDVCNSDIDVNQDVQPQDKDEIPTASSTGTVEEMSVNNMPTETSSLAVSESVVTQEGSSTQVTSNNKIMDSEPPLVDVRLSASKQINQVSEVSNLEFQLKCESISTDYVSINEKNEQKDNFNANNFPLELEVVKSEMVQPSSGNCPPIGDYMHPKDGDKEPGESHASLEDRDIKCDTEVVVLDTRNDSMDEGAPEKLNLDRSPNVNSMEEDVLENKHVDSQSIGMEEKSELNEVNDKGDQSAIDVVEVSSTLDKKIIAADEDMQPAPVAGKRQLEAAEVKEPVKRQRRWNSETVQVPNIQAPNLASSDTPKDASQPTPRRNFTRSDSTISGGSPKERIVPPSQKSATTSLRIDRFLRPFTLKAVRELLSKTGSVSEFWMDHIKTHCYVTYSSVEEAIATRDAVYNIQWPPNGGRLLVAEFVDPQEVKARVEAPESPVPVTPSPATPTVTPSQQPRHPQPSPHQHGRQQLPSPPTLPPPPPLSNPPPVREQLPPPPPLPKKLEPPVMTLDDLFRKTKTTPRVYYLPLSDEQVAAKLAVQRPSIRE
ncbi:apoptotic chromatin condensation inducer in the nucleus protein [Dioscorea alata]|uniref:Apoptotic chromatin condensation inducer in the nucleus protein n=1 Tax=Dioscorea alata TaxID=55571 RepID=A0ACB7U7I0_DIOAL|nr:apoptotic chromatin condensation inducer in the nucleus protein [Dioscorea alata]